MSLPDSAPPPALEAAALRCEIASDIHADAAAAALGLNRTDFSCLRLLFAEGPLSAGRIAERTSLTTGAITGILDRLERLGFSQRETDPQDRRRVIALVPLSAHARLETLVGGLVPSPSPDGAEDAARFLATWAQSLDAHTGQLRATSGRAQLGADPSGSVSVPLGGLRQGSFELVGGAMDVRLSRGDDMPADLIHARIDDALRISEHDGHVRLAHRPRTDTGYRPSAEVQLNANVPWALRLSGGANHATFDLAGLDVTAIEMDGGAARAEFAFGQTVRNVALQLSGGASRVTVRVPQGLAVAVSLRGMVKFTVDGRAAHVSRDTPWRTAGFGSGPGSLTIAVKGGANTLALEGVGSAGNPIVSL